MCKEYISRHKRRTTGREGGANKEGVVLTEAGQKGRLRDLGSVQKKVAATEPKHIEYPHLRNREENRELELGKRKGEKGREGLRAKILKVEERQRCGDVLFMGAFYDWRGTRKLGGFACWKILQRKGETPRSTASDVWERKEKRSIYSISQKTKREGG